MSLNMAKYYVAIVNLLLKIGHIAEEVWAEIKKPPEFLPKAFELAPRARLELATG